MADPNWTFYGDAPPITALPYSRRQFIVVTDDEAAAAERAVQEELRRDASQPGDASAENVALMLLAATPVYWQAKLAGAALLGAREAWKRWQTRNAGFFEKLQGVRTAGLPVMLVGHAEADRFLRLPLGHPRDEIVYVADPALRESYYPAADFHRRCFEQKFVEAVELVMSLGATSLEVKCEYGWSREFAASISSPLPQGATGNAKASSNSKSDNEIIFKVSKLKANDPVVPSDLAWLDSEPTWQQVVRGRTVWGAQDFALSISYEEDYGVDGNFEAKLAKFKLGVGGSFRHFQQTQWSMTGTFGDSPASS